MSSNDPILLYIPTASDRADSEVQQLSDLMQREAQGLRVPDETQALECFTIV